MTEVLNLHNIKDFKDHKFLILSKIIISKQRIEILRALFQGKVIPMQIKNTTGFSFTTISRNLKVFAELELIICRNPATKVGRIYKLTEKARDLESFFFENNILCKNIK